MGLRGNLILSSQDLHFNEIFVYLWQNRLTKYEKARIVSARALQLAMGAPALIDISSLNTPDLDVVTIAEAELEKGALPITIRRKLPNGKVVLISVKKS
ncbi:DNA-directed RNA polymerase subunit K [Sulfolobus sp. A20]|uniref:DNA-directed RNA polymerase subunit K n=1 Tax=Sulfolobaceae TaxID=118883 RepID=UPI00084627BA|nr:MULTISPECIES: DNA-directed RNA polymerase subunit K [unclassified Sulfolobus]TRM78264.1 DNA-directed RNA polymerase subunit K [Sulfolobus sp. A20-N-F8]TRM78334.1 DNA-directed RNA polymerase subunit K [Sulfolobus sp. B5]TRM82506.1 DNA-directed RNA polymerase subunit K [Sulfolobus sp. A20-N-F6]TRM85439.1 DNA-directed RNA polymerase subunit K [Sulfolobus sp. F3]TRM87036.1 DNA-directed RNA polymerase subunit K [Sulfolobus sp. E3]TRM88493.1 DNA-directed RNA polymerase subunit K [Sulfolobus sp. 